MTLALLGQLSGDRVNTDLVSVLGWPLVFYPWALAATLICGVPAFLLLRRFHLVAWWSASLAGFLVGVGVLLFIPPRIPPFKGLLPAAIAWGGIGAFSGFVFWLIWRKGKASEHV